MENSFDLTVIQQNSQTENQAASFQELKDTLSQKSPEELIQAVLAAVSVLHEKEQYCSNLAMELILESETRAALEQENSQLKAANDELRKSVGEYKEQIHSLEEQLNECLEGKDDLRANVKLSAKVKELEKEIEFCRQQYEQAAKEKSELQQQLKDSEATVEHLTVRLVWLNRKVFGSTSEGMKFDLTEENIAKFNAATIDLDVLSKATGINQEEINDVEVKRKGENGEQTGDENGNGNNNGNGENNGKDGDGDGKGGSPNEDNDQGDGKQQKKPHHSRTGTKTQNSLREDMQNLYTTKSFPYSVEFIDSKYGAGNWRMVFTETVTKLHTIPSFYYQEIIYNPVISVTRVDPATGKIKTEIHRLYTEFPEVAGDYFPHSPLTPDLLASIMYGKWSLGLPWYRTEQDMSYGAVKLTRANMAHWSLDCCLNQFQPFYDHLCDVVSKLPYSNNDETYLRALENPGRRAYVWGHCSSELSNDEHKFIVYCYEERRNTDHLRKFFPEDVAAILTCDRFADYTLLEKEREGIIVANCWNHVRTRFFDAFIILIDKTFTREMAEKTEEHKVLLLLARILEEDKALKKLTPEERLEKRQSIVAPLVNKFFSTIESYDMNEDSPYTQTFKEAVNYALNAKQGLRVFLSDPQVPIDNGQIERAFKPIEVGRRNWLFVQNAKGGNAMCIGETMCMFAKINGYDPAAYLEFLMETIPGGIKGPGRALKKEECEKLYPWNETFQEFLERRLEKRKKMPVFAESGRRPTNAEAAREMRARWAEERSQREEALTA